MSDLTLVEKDSLPYLESEHFPQRNQRVQTRDRFAVFKDKEKGHCDRSERAKSKVVRS